MVQALQRVRQRSEGPVDDRGPPATPDHAVLLEVPGGPVATHESGDGAGPAYLLARAGEDVSDLPPERLHRGRLVPAQMGGAAGPDRSQGGRPDEELPPPSERTQWGRYGERAAGRPPPSGEGRRSKQRTAGARARRYARRYGTGTGPGPARPRVRGARPAGRATDRRPDLVRLGACAGAGRIRRRLDPRGAGQAQGPGPLVAEICPGHPRGLHPAGRPRPATVDRRRPGDPPDGARRPGPPDRTPADPARDCRAPGLPPTPWGAACWDAAGPPAALGEARAREVSQDCPYCSGSGWVGLVRRRKPGPDQPMSAATRAPRSQVHCLCPLGEWMRCRTPLDLVGRMPDLAAVLAGRLPWDFET